MELEFMRYELTDCEWFAHQAAAAK